MFLRHKDDPNFMGDAIPSTPPPEVRQAKAEERKEQLAKRPSPQEQSSSDK